MSASGGRWAASEIVTEYGDLIEIRVRACLRKQNEISLQFPAIKSPTVVLRTVEPQVLRPMLAAASEASEVIKLQLKPRSASMAGVFLCELTALVVVSGHHRRFNGSRNVP